MNNTEHHYYFETHTLPSGTTVSFVYDEDYEFVGLEVKKAAPKVDGWLLASDFGPINDDDRPF